MIISIRADVYGKTTGKGKLFEAKVGSNRTSLTMEAEGVDDILVAAIRDVHNMSFDKTKAMITAKVRESKSIGALANRTGDALEKLGLALDTQMGWDAGEGTITIKTNTQPLQGADIPFLTEILIRMADRATRGLSATQHPLTLYDLKQAIGLVQDLQAEEEWATRFNEWSKDREAADLQYRKDLAKVARARKKKEKEKEEAPAKAKADKEAIAKAKAKAKKVISAKDRALAKARERAQLPPKADDRGDAGDDIDGEEKNSSTPASLGDLE